MMSGSEKNGQRPKALSMMLCDAVWRDPSTGKTFIQGGFTAVTAREFPCSIPRFCAYIALTEICGEIPIKIRLVHLDGDDTDPKEISSAQAKVNSDDPLAVAEGECVFQDVVLEKPGEYRLVLECDGEPLLERRLVAIPTGDQQP